MKRKVILLIASLTASGLACAANPQMPDIPSAVFNVTHYGAIGDGVTDNTISIQKAIDADAASKAGGGTVEIPAGT